MTDGYRQHLRGDQRVTAEGVGLVLRRRKTSELGAGFTPCDVRECLSSTAGANHKTRSSAQYQAFMAGHHAGWLCPKHAKEWRASWDEAAA